MHSKSEMPFGSPAMRMMSPVLMSSVSSFRMLVVRISGPLVSIRMPISGDTVLTFVIILLKPSSFKCAEFIRTTFMPDSNSSRMKSTSQRLSEIVATILVCLDILSILLTFYFELQYGVNGHSVRIHSVSCKCLNTSGLYHGVVAECFTFVNVGNVH